MAKGKKKDTDFQEALLSKTKVINKKQKSAAPQQQEDGSKQAAFKIKPELLKKLKQLSDYHKIELEELVNLALEHFINLEHLWFDETILNKE